MLPVAAITGTGKVVLLLVGGTFIVYALVCSMWLPKRFPGFPGKHLPAFFTVTAVLFAAQLGAVYWVTDTQEVEHEAAAETENGGSATEPAETETTETEPAETEGGATGAGSVAAGREVFEANCGSCHTLADAGTDGSVGPNLDDAKPDEALVVDRVTNGQGIMPSFQDQLSEQQIADVAAYVSSVAGQ